MQTFLDFEKPIAELEGKIEELRHLEGSGEVNIAEEISKLQAKAEVVKRFGRGRAVVFSRRRPDGQVR